MTDRDFLRERERARIDELHARYKKQTLRLRYAGGLSADELAKEEERLQAEYMVELGELLVSTARTESERRQWNALLKEGKALRKFS